MKKIQGCRTPEEHPRPKHPTCYLPLSIAYLVSPTQSIFLIFSWAPTRVRTTNKVWSIHDYHIPIGLARVGSRVATCSPTHAVGLVSPIAPHLPHYPARSPQLIDQHSELQLRGGDQQFASKKIAAKIVRASNLAPESTFLGLSVSVVVLREGCGIPDRAKDKVAAFSIPLRQLITVCKSAGTDPTTFLQRQRPNAVRVETGSCEFVVFRLFVFHLRPAS